MIANWAKTHYGEPYQGAVRTQSIITNITERAHEFVPDNEPAEPKPQNPGWENIRKINAIRSEERIRRELNDETNLI